MFRNLLYILLISVLPAYAWQPEKQHNDSEQLGKAIEYFQSEKYHEAMIIFRQLDKTYRLNPRFKAYLGVCFYYEWDYEKAATHLDESIPQLGSFAPHERSFYYYADAESHFNLKQYAEAIPLYEMMLTVCYPNERAEALFKLGLCYAFTDKWNNSYDYLTSSLAYYETFDNSRQKARISQIKNMLGGCMQHLDIENDTINGTNIFNIHTR
ncbi:MULTISPECIES: tetratricopeptide repeat protein [Prevotellaceae]|uniref:tetratricopeptide repeat protein n=1 Tax=Prevotellaceae TaxID=171552 RepID=UPI0003D31EE1|nr:hypothetical protein [Prevotella phocaeensis]ETD21501.1 hypothetical protein HMPREF1199_00575 [Hoylesella oralis CC98A]